MDDFEPHFDKRAKERGITSVKPAALRTTLEAAVRAGDTRIVEHVMNRHGRGIWRFMLPVEGVFYVVIDPKSGRACTLLTQKMLRGYKATDRKFKATRSARRRHVQD